MSSNLSNAEILNTLLEGKNLWSNNFRPPNTNKDLVGSGFDTSN